jgi:uncharacterized protein
LAIGVEADNNGRSLSEFIDTNAGSVVGVVKRSVDEAMIQVMIKPTTKCNLNCIYCNVEERSNMNLSIGSVKRFFSILSERFPEEGLSIKWHGGEPLLMGVDFFDSAIKWQESLSSDFQNAIATNLTLLSGDYLKLLKDHNFTIYTSVDGIGAPHDFQRDGSFDKVRRALIDLKNSAILDVFVTSTVTKHNVSSLGGVYDLCLSLGYKWKFSVVIPAGMQETQAESLTVNPLDFSTAIIRIFDSWFVAETPIEIPVFDGVIKYILQKDDYIEDSEPPFTLGPDENLYVCPLLVGSPQYAVGKFDNPNSMKKVDCLTCSWQRITFRKCESCYFDFFCKIIHCAYLYKVNNRFNPLPNYLCSCWEPIYSHILERVTNEIGVRQITKRREIEWNTNKN